MSNRTGLIMNTLHRNCGLLVTISLALVVLPFIALSCYNHPSIDDILDAVTVKNLGFWGAQKYFYFNHTGRYTTTVLLALINPLLYTRLETHWWSVTIGFIVGTLLVLKLYFSALLKISSGQGWRLAGIILCLWLAYAPGMAEGLFWFTGAYTYLVTAWLLMLWMLVLSRYTVMQRKGQYSNRWLVVVSGLTVAVAGTTEPIAFPFLIALLLGTGLSWCLHRSWVLLLLAALAVAGSAVSFGAPGNFVRMASMDASFGLIKTVVYSAATTGYLLFTWIGNPVLLTLSALLLPDMYRITRHRNQLLIEMLANIPSWLFAGISTMLLMAANCPAYYASGTGLPLRARTTLYLLFLLGWLGVLLTWCSRQARRERPSPVLQALITGKLAPLWLGLLVLFFFADYNVQTRATMLGQGSNNVVRAYRQWLGGDAARYDAEVRARYKTLHTNNSVVLIKPLSNRPELLYSFDIVGFDNPQALQLYAIYFGKKQVVTLPYIH